MSALQAALRELRECADTGMTTGLLAHEIAALTGHIDRLHAAVLAADERPEGWSVTVADAAAEARALVPARQDTPAEVPLAALAMTRQAPREFDPCLIRFERRGNEIWANFFDQDGQATGTSTHQGDATTAGLIAYYEYRGWSVAEPAEDESGAVR